MFMKKFALAAGMGLFLAFGGVSGVSIPFSVEMAEAYSDDLQIDQSTAWFDEDNREFGAKVCVNGEWQNISYKQVSNGDYTTSVYQSKGHGWVFVGTLGPSSAQMQFPSQLSKRLYILVANTAAQSHGYQKMGF